MIRVLGIKDVGYVGVPVRALLSGKPGISYVGTLPFGSETIHRAVELDPGVIVFDTEYMVGQILPYAGELQNRLPRCSQLLLSDPSKRGMLPPRRRAGQLSFLLRNASEALLVDSVRRLADGERIVHPRLQAAALNTDRGLTTRELEVLGLAAEGESVNDIAHRLYLSGGTVRNYLSAVITKTGARNRLDAIRIVRKDGWLH